MSNIVPINDIQKMATSATKSGMFPVKSIEQAMTLMMIAQSENIHPMSAFMMYDIIGGKPALKATEILSRFQKSGGMVEWLETSNDIAKGKFTHPKGGSITIEWNMERAKKAGLSDRDNWKKHTAQMLRARAVTEAVRAIYPVCLNNMHSSDEVIDFAEVNPINETVEVEVESIDTKVMKIRLSGKLKGLGMRNADIKEFAEFAGLSDNDNLLTQLANDDAVLSEYLDKFENKDN